MTGGRLCPVNQYTTLPNIFFRESKVHKCSFNGKRCLLVFIKTRYHQPNICLHCLKEKGIINNYKILKIQIYGQKGAIWEPRKEEVTKEQEINESIYTSVPPFTETIEEYRETSQTL